LLESARVVGPLIHCGMQVDVLYAPDKPQLLGTVYPVP